MIHATTEGYVRLLRGFINVTAPVQITMDQCVKQVQGIRMCVCVLEDVKWQINRQRCCENCTIRLSPLSPAFHRFSLELPLACEVRGKIIFHRCLSVCPQWGRGGRYSRSLVPCSFQGGREGTLDRTGVPESARRDMEPETMIPPSKTGVAP